MQKDRLKNKKVLLIIPKFYEYEKFIKSEIESRCVSVRMIYENPFNYNYIFILIKKFFLKALPVIMELYFYIHFLFDKMEYDYVLVIKGEYLSDNCIKYLKCKNNKKCEYIMYQWDSLIKSPIALKNIFHFHRVYSFDRLDCLRYNLIYRPLFYIDYLISNKQVKYDLINISTYTNDRMKMFRMLLDYFKDKKYKICQFLYIGNINYFVQKYFIKNRLFHNIKHTQLISSRISLCESYKLYSNSNVVFDYTNPNQNGFTMRTIEAIGSKCKIITNNKEILNADFYNTDNIYIYDVNKFEIPETFLNSECKEMNQLIYNKYSISKFIDDIFNINDK